MLVSILDTIKCSCIRESQRKLFDSLSTPNSLERKVDAGDAVMALKHIEELDFDELTVSEGPKVVSLIVTMH